MFGDPRTPIGNGKPFAYEMGTAKGKSTGGVREIRIVKELTKMLT
jgi:hypothetical protein